MMTVKDLKDILNKFSENDVIASVAEGEICIAKDEFEKLEIGDKVHEIRLTNTSFCEVDLCVCNTYIDYTGEKGICLEPIKED